MSPTPGIVRWLGQGVVQLREANILVDDLLWRCCCIEVFLLVLSFPPFVLKQKVEPKVQEKNEWLRPFFSGLPQQHSDNYIFLNLLLFLYHVSVPS